MSDDEAVSGYNGHRRPGGKTGGRGSNAGVTGGAGSGTRKADNAAAWLRVPLSREEASKRPRSYKKG